MTTAKDHITRVLRTTTRIEGVIADSGEVVEFWPVQNYRGFVLRDAPLTQAELAGVDLRDSFDLEQQNVRGGL